MALVLADRVQETTTSTGTGSVILAGAVNGYQTFTAGVGNGNTCYYTIYDNTSFSWEVGIGTYTTSPNTLTRNTILSSSNSGSAINLAGNTAAVWVDLPSSKAAYVGATITAMNLSSPTIVGGTINNAVIGGSTAAAGTFTTATVGTLSATSLTSTAASFGTIVSGTWNGGVIGLAYGGTNANLTAVAGASVYSTGSALALTAAGTSGQILTSGGSGSPVWTSTLSGLILPSPTLTGTALASTITFGTLGGTFVSSTTVAIPNQSLTATLNAGPLQIGPALTFSDTGIAKTSAAILNSYYQNVIQNQSNGATASSEYIAYSDQGSAAGRYITMGMNSSGYTGSGAVNAANSGFLVTGASSDLAIGTVGLNPVHFFVNSGATDAMTIATSGLVTIPSATLGAVQINSLGVGTPSSGTAGEIRATNNVTAFYSSDNKFKEDIKPIQSALEKANYIGGKTFSWTQEYINKKGGEDGFFVNKYDFGVIAQDVQAVFPLAVRTREDGSLAVDYSKLVALAFQAIVELKAEIEQLKGK
jgi:hypothetical protein